MINTANRLPNLPQPSSAHTLKESSAGHDAFELCQDSRETTSGVNLYDMSPVWSPKQGPIKIPMWVRGLA